MRLKSVGACLASCFALAWGTTVGAEPLQLGEIVAGYTYYNKAGATLSQHYADLDFCVRRTAFEAPNQNLVWSLVWSGPIAGRKAAQVENCMVVLGWRVFRLSESEGAPLSALPPVQLDAQLATMVGAPTPPGELMRQFGNEVAHNNAAWISGDAKRPGKEQLSLTAYAASELAAEPDRAETRKPTRFELVGDRTAKRVKPEKVGNLPTQAYIVVGVAGIGKKSGSSGVTFARSGPSPDISAASVDSQADFASANVDSTLFAKPMAWWMFAVAPGRWRLAYHRGFSLCLGAPSFEVHPGEVVYAGTYDVLGTDVGPNLELAPAQAYVGAALASRVRPAEYRNGDLGPCHELNTAYALEVSGAPFLEGYKWGSLAQPAR